MPKIKEKSANNKRIKQQYLAAVGEAALLVPAETLLPAVLELLPVPAEAG